MKANQGKTLADAVTAYKAPWALKEQVARPGFKTEIRDHNQFNQYTRDFLTDNPDATLAEVRRIWALKRALPSENGRRVNERSDLELGCIPIVKNPVRFKLQTLQPKIVLLRLCK